MTCKAPNDLFLSLSNHAVFPSLQHLHQQKLAKIIWVVTMCKTLITTLGQMSKTENKSRENMMRIIGK